MPLREGGTSFRPRRSLALVQALVTAGVVAAFLVATAVVDRQSTAIGTAAEAIAGNALPSVQALSDARGAIRQLDDALDKWVEEANRGDHPAIASLGGYLDGIEGMLARYGALPAFPDEREQFAPLRARISEAEADAGRLVAALRAGDVARAQAALLDEKRSAAVCDTDLQHLADFNVMQAEMQASAIAAIRRSILRTSFLLDGAALLLAILVTGLSVLMLRRGIASLLSAGANAERRSAELERFAGRVAHDILSPLGAVQLALAFVERRTPGDVAVTNALARASRAITRVHRLVDGLLGYARAGAHPDKEAVANVRDVVRDVVDGLAPEARERGVEIHVECPEVLAVCCSQGVLTSVVSNLVQNAIKYIGAAPVRVVAIRATSIADDRVRVEVEDTGPGVPADAAASIFEPFVRGRSDAEGIGLGLATVRQLVRAHGGEVGVRSRPGEGSVFWAELPRATEPAHSQGA